MITTKPAADRGAQMNDYLQLVEPIAKQYENQGLSLDELIKKGNLGLKKATEKFDEENHKSFTEYATWWIRQNIMQALAEEARKDGDGKRD